MYIGEVKMRGVVSVSVFIYYHHRHHAEGVALDQQRSPFKGKTDPVPSDHPLSPSLYYPASPGNGTCPHPKHESSLVRQNHVRRLQRR